MRTYSTMTLMQSLLHWTRLVVRLETLAIENHRREIDYLMTISFVTSVVTGNPISLATGV